MSFPALQLTNAGRQIIIKALSGDCEIEFTKFGVGNGDAPADANLLTDLVNIVKSLSINTITPGVGCVNLSGTLDNANLEAGFWWKELGVFATDPDIGEVLYAYAHAGDYAEFIPAFSTQNYLRTTLNVTVVVGDAENVTAVLDEYVGYATTEQFEGHTNDTTNPHRVTAEQVGLGNVPNVATNDQQPTFTAAGSVATINSGEKLSVILGKVKAAISALITHFNTSNPHGITTTLIGAAKTSHTHSAADITSGILGAARGGTGLSSLSSLITTRELTVHKKINAGNGDTITFTVPTVSGYTAFAIIPLTIGLNGAAGSPNAGIYSITIPSQKNGYVQVENRENSQKDIEVQLMFVYIKNS